MTDLAPTQMLGMSDDDFLKLNEPVSGDAPAADETNTNTTPAEGEAGAAQEGGAASPTGDAAGEDEGAKTNAQAPSQDATNTAAAPEPGGDKSGDQGSGADGSNSAGADPSATGSNTGGADPLKSAEKKPEGASETAAQAPDYEAFYKQIMAPFKANGKTIELKDPAEVISLMQMGANYTRKMQDIQPHRKVLLMLQNNGLLDEGKLSYLIDLDKKNPEAIKKLIKDSGIDPLEIDTEAEPAYQGGDHRVTDEEAAFRSVLEDLGSSDVGRATITEINTTWDETSKAATWQHPEIMTIIHQQRENGIYDVITSEINRLRVLGQIKPEVPFIEAYKMVGDALSAANQGANGQSTSTPENPVKPEPQVLGTSTATPKKEVADDDRVNAAAPTRAAPAADKKIVNPLAISDDEFMKNFDRFQGRV